MTLAVTAIVPEGIDDPLRPSGGNRYDRLALDALRAVGWQVTETAVTGPWPNPDEAARGSLAAALDRAPAGAPVLIDGLIASAAADLVVAAATRLPVVVLVHMPLGPVDPTLTDAERAMLGRVSAVVTTSAWTQDWLIGRYRLTPNRIRVAAPGAQAAPPARPSVAGGRLLCVAAVTRSKGYDALLEALADLSDMDWCCACVGSLQVDPGFARTLRRTVVRRGLADRVRFTGPLSADALAERYAQTDLLVLPSRAETWGMVVTEALARAVPVIATDVGGIAEALGRAPDGSRPGMLVPAGDPGALAAALRDWLSDAALRRWLRESARARRPRLPGWEQTAARLNDVLTGARPCGPAGPAPATEAREGRGSADGDPAVRGWVPSLSR